MGNSKNYALPSYKWYWLNDWHILISKGMSSFTSNTLLISIQYCYQFKYFTDLIKQWEKLLNELWNEINKTKWNRWIIPCAASNRPICGLFSVIFLFWLIASAVSYTHTHTHRRTTTRHFYRWGGVVGWVWMDGCLANSHFILCLVAPNLKRLRYTTQNLYSVH